MNTCVWIFLLACIGLSNMAAIAIADGEIASLRSQLAQARQDVEDQKALCREASPKKSSLTVTAYAKSGLTASGEKSRPGQVAVSRDLHAEGWDFGSRICLPVTDLMAAGKKRSIDIRVPSKKRAREFGRRVAEVAR